MTRKVRSPLYVLRALLGTVLSMLFGGVALAECQNEPTYKYHFTTTYAGST